MRDHHTFWHAGRARGIDHVRQVVVTLDRIERLFGYLLKGLGVDAQPPNILRPGPTSVNGSLGEHDPDLARLQEAM
jgi:hypothetical protein